MARALRCTAEPSKDSLLLKLLEQEAKHPNYKEGYQDDRHVDRDSAHVRVLH
jgi:hypothetical protein